MSYSVIDFHRRSIRLKNYDYSQPGMYFITICTQHRLCLFGDVVNKEMHLNNAGIMVADIWIKLIDKFKLISLFDYILMPNHLHALIQINNEGGESISQIMQYFKSFSSLQYIAGVKKYSWKNFPGKLWQRNYYEHVVRNIDVLEKIQQYIIFNPQDWDNDKENPKYF